MKKPTALENIRNEKAALYITIGSILPGKFEMIELLRRGLWERYTWIIETDTAVPQELQDEIQEAVDQTSPALPGINLIFEVKNER